MKRLDYATKATSHSIYRNFWQCLIEKLGTSEYLLPSFYCLQRKGIFLLAQLVQHYEHKTHCTFKLALGRLAPTLNPNLGKKTH